MENKEVTTVSRRNFGKMSAAAGIAVISGCATVGTADKSTELLKIGLLGCGGRGTGAAQNMLEGNENVKIIALADLFKDKVDNTRKQLTEHTNPKIRNKVAIADDHCFTGLDASKKILSSDIDIILIGTIPYGKPAQLEEAVAAKKHVFIEKPIAVDPVGIRRFIAAAKKHKELGLSLVAGTQRRHQRAYIETIDKIHNGELGEILAMRAYWCGGLPWVRERDPKWSDMEYRIRNWINYCWTSGDNIVEQHVHNLDVCNWVLKSHPISVFASGGRNWKPVVEKYGDLYDHFDCDYEYPNGVHVTSMSRHWDGCEGGVFEEAIGTKGRKMCDALGQKGIDPYVQEHIDLVKGIRGEGPVWHQGIEVAESTMTSIMGRMSAYTGKAVKWDDAMSSDLGIVPDPLNFDVKIPVWSVPCPVNMKKV